MPISALDEGLSGECGLQVLRGIQEMTLIPRCAAFFSAEHNGVRIVCGNCDGVNALRDQRIDDFDLAFRRGAGRAGYR